MYPVPCNNRILIMTRTGILLFSLPSPWVSACRYGGGGRGACCQRCGSSHEEAAPAAKDQPSGKTIATNPYVAKLDKRSKEIGAKLKPKELEHLFYIREGFGVLRAVYWSSAMSARRSRPAPAIIRLARRYPETFQRLDRCGRSGDERKTGCHRHRHQRPDLYQGERDQGLPETDRTGGGIRQQQYRQGNRHHAGGLQQAVVLDG